MLSVVAFLVLLGHVDSYTNALSLFLAASDMVEFVQVCVYDFVKFYIEHTSPVLIR